MTLPLVVLAVFAWFCAFGGEQGNLYLMLTGDAPDYVAAGIPAATATGLTMPDHAAVHAVHAQAGTWALVAALSGAFLAYVLYGMRAVNVEDMKNSLAGVHGFLSNKWAFDDLYDALFMRPAHKVAAFCAWIDRALFDSILHALAKITVLVAKWDRIFDENVVDGFVNLIGSATQSFGRSLRTVQTGKLRQYVMFIVVGVVVLFAVLFSTFPS